MHFPFHDTRASGYNNRTALVEHQLGHGGYEVVRTIYDNIQWIHHLYEQLPRMQEVGRVIPHVEMIARYTYAIEALVNNLGTLTNLENNLELVQGLAPQIQAFKDKLDTLNGMLAENQEKTDNLNLLVQDGFHIINSMVQEADEKFARLVEEYKRDINQETKALKCLVQKFTEEFGTQYRELKDNRAKLQVYLKKVEEMSKEIAHLRASEAVNTYLWSDTPETKRAASLAVQKSEQAGNVEKINKQKLLAVKADLNLFKVLNENNLRLAHENGVNNG